MKTNIKNTMKNAASRTTTLLKKHSPDILMGAGLVLGVGTIAAACKGTIKAKEILEESKETINVIEQGMVSGAVADQEYTESDGTKDLRLVYIQTGVKLLQVYIPAIAIGSMSVACVLASHDILKKRNVALSAAYAAIDSSFKEYRQRVVERFGEDIDRELRYNICKRQSKEVTVDEVTGEEQVSVNDILAADPELKSDYARYFDERSRNFENDRQYNLMFLRAQESYLNDQLQIRGHLFLNEVYDALDIPRTAAGQIVGWTSTGGDGYVNLRITEVETVNDKGRHISRFIIDPNVQGDVWSLMK